MATPPQLATSSVLTYSLSLDESLRVIHSLVSISKKKKYLTETRANSDLFKFCFHFYKFNFYSLTVSDTHIIIVSFLYH